MRVIHRDSAGTTRPPETVRGYVSGAWTAFALGALTGLVAALGMSGLMLVLRVVLGLPTSAEMIGDRLTAFINYRGLPPDYARISTLVSLALTYGVYGLLLVAIWRLTWMPTNVVERISTGRRALVLGGVGALLALATGGLLKQLAELATFGYDGREYRGADLQPITPTIGSTP